MPSALAPELSIEAAVAVRYDCERAPVQALTRGHDYGSTASRRGLFEAVDHDGFQRDGHGLCAHQLAIGGLEGVPVLLLLLRSEAAHNAPERPPTLRLQTGHTVKRKLQKGGRSTPQVYCLWLCAAGSLLLGCSFTDKHAGG